MHKQTKRLIITAPIVAVLTVAFYAWASNPTQGNLRIDSLAGARPPGVGVDTYTVVVKSNGSDSSYNVRVVFRIPDDFASQNTSLPSAAGSVVTPLNQFTGGDALQCPDGTGTHLRGSVRTVICTGNRFDPGDAWTITIPTNNSAGTNRLASVQVFADSPEGTTVDSTNMSDNFKAIINSL